MGSGGCEEQGLPQPRKRRVHGATSTSDKGECYSSMHARAGPFSLFAQRSSEGRICDELMALFLGVDGGQSSTKAIIGDRTGRVIGMGQGGPCNHVGGAEGREKLVHAVGESV